MSGDATGYIQNVHCVNGKLRFTSNGQWYEITTDASRSGISITHLFTFDQSHTLPLNDFNSLITPYTAILLNGSQGNGGYRILFGGVYYTSYILEGFSRVYMDHVNGIWKNNNGDIAVNGNGIDQCRMYGIK